MEDRTHLDPVAVAHSFDGYGYQFIDNGSGSSWLKRGMEMPDATPLYSAPPDVEALRAEIKRLREACKAAEIALLRLDREPLGNRQLRAMEVANGLREAYSPVR